MNFEKPYMTHNELWHKNIESPSWLIKDTISKGGITLLIGEPKSSKSWLALLMGISIAKGIDFLDNFPTKQGKVLYIDEENGEQTMQDRVQRLCEGLNIGDNLDMDYMIYKDIKLDTKGIYRHTILLENYIKDNQPSLIICDSIVRFMEGNENSSEDVRRIFDNLKHLKETYGTAFLLLHHTTKSTKDARGSGDFKGFCDDMFACTRMNGKNAFVLNQKLSRRNNIVSNVQYVIEGDEHDAIIFNYIGKKKTTAENVAEKIMNWCQYKEGFKRDELPEHLEIGQNTTNALNSLIGKVLFKEGLGKFKVKGFGTNKLAKY